MANKAPIFPMAEPQHFNDYGFDPQFNYFQVLEESREQNRETQQKPSIHFKLQKPISKDEFNKSKKKKWWNMFLKWNNRVWIQHPDPNNNNNNEAAIASRASISGPVYMTEIRSGSSTPYSYSYSGNLNVPYLSLRELNMEHHHTQRISTSTPVYLIT